MTTTKVEGLYHGDYGIIEACTREDGSEIALYYVQKRNGTMKNCQCTQQDLEVRLTPLRPPLLADNKVR